MNVKKCNQPEFISGLIEIYRNNPCLWKIKSKCYSNRVLREKAYLHLLEYYKRADDNATIDTVKNKINNLRSSFRKELKKVKKAGSEGAYKPSLWYYDLLLFTSDQEEPLQPMSCDDDEHETGAENCDYETKYSIQECVSSAPAFQDVFEDTDNSLQSPLARIGNSTTSSWTCTTSATKGLAPKRKSLAEPRGIMKKVCNLLAEDKKSDEFDTIGENIAHKFRRMNDEQRIFAEHLINNVLYYAVQNKLNNESEIVLNNAVKSENAYNFNYHTNQIPISNQSSVYQPELH